MEKRIDVFAVGALNVDLIIHGDAPRDMEELTQWVGLSRVELCPAGSVGYCAIALARLGLKVYMFSTVADDLFGKWIVQSLKEEGIDTKGINFEKDTLSGIGIYLLLFGSKKRPLTGRLATNRPWLKKIPAVVEKQLKSARALHCGGYLHYPQMWGAATEQLFKKAKQYGLLTSIDSQFPLQEVQKPWIKHFGNLPEYLDLLLTDELESEMISGEKNPEHSARMLIETGIKMVAIKMGQKGALLASGNEYVHQPAFKVEGMVDSIGAGDAFDAGVIYGALKGWHLKKIAEFASAVAAHTLKGIGGTQTAPRLSEVMQLLKACKINKKGKHFFRRQNEADT